MVRTSGDRAAGIEGGHATKLLQGVRAIAAQRPCGSSMIATKRAADTTHCAQPLVARQSPIGALVSAGESPPTAVRVN